MSTTSPQPSRADAVSWVIVLTLTFAWFLFLFFERGHPYDEAEHAHVSWLISQGKQPINDFFQHHMPLLWSLLALYFRAGFTGAGVLIWGRILVILSGIISLVSLWMLGRNPPNSRRLMSYLGCAVFIGLTAFLPDLFVIRPETIAAGCFLAGLAIWNRSDEWTLLLLAGASTGAAMYATPRFVLLGGLFFLLGKNSVRRWLLLATGALVFVAVYTKLSGFGIDKIIFSLRFSSHLQSVGSAFGGRSERTWLGLALITCLPIAWMALRMRRADRVRAASLIVYTVLVFLASNHVAGLFRYAQAYAPMIVAVSVAAAWVGGRAEWQMTGLPELVPILTAMLLLPGVHELRRSRPRFDFIASVRARDKLAAMVPAGGTVLVYTKDNPITVPDASYYGIPLADGDNRLCRAIETFRSNIRLPECDFLKILQQDKPYLVDATIRGATVDAGRAQQIIDKDYGAIDLGPGYPEFLQGDIEKLDAPLALTTRK